GRPTVPMRACRVIAIATWRGSRASLNHSNNAIQVRPRVGDHARAQVLPPRRDRSEQDAVDDDLDDRPRSFVEVADAEYGGLQGDGGRQAAGERVKLALEIASEDQLFTESGRNGDEHPDKFLGGVSRQK